MPAAALDLQFAAPDRSHSESAAKYEAIWSAEGRTILAALEERACASFPVPTISVRVEEAPSFSGTRARPMRLRASYPEPVKRGILVHELGHWLIPPEATDATELSTHQALNLLLLQVWEDLWGPAFVRAQIATESGFSEQYRADWQWVLRLTTEQRRSTWSAVLEASGRSAKCFRRPMGMCFVEADRCRPQVD